MGLSRAHEHGSDLESAVSEDQVGDEASKKRVFVLDSIKVHFSLKVFI
jgi:hypothetical protein